MNLTIKNIFLAISICYVSFSLPGLSTGLYFASSMDNSSLKKRIKSLEEHVNSLEQRNAELQGELKQARDNALQFAQVMAEQEVKLKAHIANLEQELAQTTSQ